MFLHFVGHFVLPLLQACCWIINIIVGAIHEVWGHAALTWLMDKDPNISLSLSLSLSPSLTHPKINVLSLSPPLPLPLSPSLTHPKINVLSLSLPLSLSLSLPLSLTHPKINVVGDKVKAIPCHTPTYKVF